MSAVPKTADISGDPTLLRLIAEARDARQPIVLLAGGRALMAGGSRFVGAKGAGDLASLVGDVANGTPNRRQRDRRRIDPKEALAAIEASAGGWKGLVDGDMLVEEIYAARDAEIERQTTPFG